MIIVNEVNVCTRMLSGSASFRPLLFDTPPQKKSLLTLVNGD